MIPPQITLARELGRLEADGGAEYRGPAASGGSGNEADDCGPDGAVNGDGHRQRL